MKLKKLIPQSVRAAKLAAEAHSGQTDLIGEPYIHHLKRVARMGYSSDEVTVAWLHDIIEDTPITSADLKAHGFKDNVIKAVEAITHLKGQDYDDYMEQVAHNPLAVTVKRYDLLDHVNYKAKGVYGRVGWEAPPVMQGHPKLLIYKKFLAYLKLVAIVGYVPVPENVDLVNA